MMVVMPSVPPNPRTPFNFEEIILGVNEVVGSESKKRMTFCSGVEKKTESNVGCGFRTRAIMILSPLD